MCMTILNCAGWPQDLFKVLSLCSSHNAPSHSDETADSKETARFHLSFHA